MHLVVGFDGLAYDDPDFYTLQVLSTLLGGGMSSRLFQEIRERRTLDEPPSAEESTPVLTIREAEKRAVKAALEKTGGKKGAAAALLGISWPTLNRKIREYGL